MTGWSVRTFAQVGKTEVLCRSADELKALKSFAGSISSSDVYPSFDPLFGYSLYFFDIRPEFVEWLESYIGTRPVEIKEEEPSRVTGGSARKFRIQEGAIAFATLAVLVAAFFAYSPMITRADVIAPSAAGMNPAVSLPLPQKKDIVGASEHHAEESGPDEDSVIITEIDLRDTAHRDSNAASAPAIAVARPYIAPAGAGVSGELKLWFVDVGQGDGIIIKLPGGDFVVVDCNKGAGEKMAGVLASLGCVKIKAMVLTHPHSDHLGGLEDVIEKFPVESFYDAGIAHPTAGYMRLLKAVDRMGCKYYSGIAPGASLAWDPNVRVIVLNCGNLVDDEVNNASVILRVEFGRTAVVLTGDAEAPVEDRLVSNFSGRLRADLLKVGHHGSRSSSSPAFLREVAPKFAVISCSTGNTYGHPAPQTLRNLEALGARIYRTDLQGTVTATSDGVSFTIRTER